MTPDLTNEAARSLAEIAVTSERRTHFAQRLPGVLEQDCEYHRSRVRFLAVEREQLNRVAKAARELYAAIRDLDLPARRRLAIQIYRKKTTEVPQEISDIVPVGGGMAPAAGNEFASILVSIEAASIAANALAGKATIKLNGRPPTKRLDPSRPFNIDAAELLIQDIESLVDDCGGHLTLDHTAGKGTWIDFLRELSGFLPSDLLPDGLFDADEGGRIRGIGWLRHAVERARGHRPRRIATGQKPPKK